MVTLPELTVAAGYRRDPLPHVLQHHRIAPNSRFQSPSNLFGYGPLFPMLRLDTYGKRAGQASNRTVGRM